MEIYRSIRKYLDEFTFENAPINFLNPHWTIWPCVFYAVSCWGLQWIMKNVFPVDKNAPKKQTPFGKLLNYYEACHNFFLSLLSLFMFLGLFFKGYVRTCLIEKSVMAGLCNTKNHVWFGGEATFWYWVFLASKYVEFIDTYIRIIERKPVTLLHFWHHLTVPIHEYLCLMVRWDCALFGNLVNSFVHIIMYYYYGLVCFNIRVWWKKLITSIQIIQFYSCIILLIVTYTFSGSCTWKEGNWIAMVSTFTFYVSYLVLFMDFYSTAYNKKPTEKKEEKKTE